MRAAPTYAQAVRQDAIARLMKGESAVEVAQQLAIDVEELERWRTALQ
ncbi:MAG: hypothetical protein H7066_08480 [Cytophagaceae bacterium]|nr:hypothetical protein [Gemmatimonadaceae bacterium]